MIHSELQKIEDKLFILRAESWLEKVRDLTEGVFSLQCAYRRLSSEIYSSADKEAEHEKVNAIVDSLEKLVDACDQARKIDIRTIVCEECDRHFPAFTVKPFAVKRPSK